MQSLQNGNLRWRQLAIATGLFVVLVYNQFFLNQLLDFSLGGRIPGTNSIISPDKVLAFCISMIILVLVGAIARFGGYVHSKRAVSSIGRYTASEDTEVSLKQNKGTLYASEAITIKLHIACMRGVARARDVYDEVSLRQESRFVRTGRIMEGYVASLQEIGFFAAQCAVKVLHRTEVAGKRLWIIAEPHLRACDAWLEMRVKRLHSNMVRRLRRSEAFMVVSDVFAEPLRRLR